MHRKVLLLCSIASMLVACDDNAVPANEPLGQTLAEYRPADPNQYPAIVIGSGYGGSVAALRLGERGINTLVLERGRDWTIKDPTTDSTFATMEQVLTGNGGKTAWLYNHVPGNFYLLSANIPLARTTGILETVDATPEMHRDASPALRMNGVNGLAAAGVGGGSLVNNTVTYPPTEEGFKLAFPESELPFMPKVWKQLKKTYFDRALQNLKPETIPADLLARPEYESTRLMDQYAATAGYPKEDPSDPTTLTFGRTLAPVLIDWNKVREETTGARVPSVIKGEAWWGTNSGARKSLNTPQGYLGRAVATGKVTVKALHTVSDISYDTQKSLYVVQVVHTDESYNTLETLTFTTPKLILAAGSLGTTKLLVRARDTGKLPKLNADVGTRWSTNGNMAHLHLTGTTKPLPQGGPAGIKLTDFREPTNPVVLENLPQRAPPNPTANPAGAPQDAVLTIGLGIPQGKGSFHYEAATDTVVLDWPADGGHNVYQRVTSLYSAFTPGTFVQIPEARAMGTTLHPLGGAPLGLATNKGCQLKGYDGLYVVDSALVPGAAAVTNPSMLITSLAERCMDRILEDVTGSHGDFDHDD
ncbi:MAG: cholesterol oxidase [Myxococcaceae bacterium]|nr:cholesterol oxidase [Myxococcaceae bacterium]